ncbi:sensor histidine kinase [Caldalkalibacillus mannanilyticus]|uniref:sensor histidine kinase n=1 Tax=Caldalkalibacillus mannanilyticus TaxID=1418 RepID=UPI0004680D77|nr:HAMP domain-containing sensor histidine kinase [Caldalkalibacillus mannanilyticus]
MKNNRHNEVEKLYFIFIFQFLSLVVLLLSCYFYPHVYTYLIGGILFLAFSVYLVIHIQQFFDHNMQRVEQELLYEKKIKQQMVEDLSHEIKTPLSTLRGQMEAMMDGLLEADEKTLQLSIKQIDRITDLVDELDVSLDALHLTGKLKAVSLSDFLKQISSNFELICQSKGASYEMINHLKYDYELLLDVNRMYQAFFNILSNSIKFIRAKNPTFKLIVEESEHHIHFFLADNGVGISEEDEPYVFERLYKGDFSRKREKDSSSGLGLFITKEIVQYHGGQIMISHPSICGSGCTLLIKLPKPKLWVSKNFT